jgi:hypothetical protein
MIQIGQYVVQGFAQGIRGSSDEIKGAFHELNQKLTDAMATARETSLLNRISSISCVHLRSPMLLRSRKLRLLLLRTKLYWLGRPQVILH